MRRIIEPLSLMGATLSGDDDSPPIAIRGGALRGIDFTPPVASAQVKTAVLLAASTRRATRPSESDTRHVTIRSERSRCSASS